MGLLAQVEGPYEVVADGESTVLVLEPKSRSPRTIEFRPDDILAPIEGLTLKNGMTLRFQTFVEEGEGSGGATKRLQGTLGGKWPTYVICTAQGDDVHPDWCISLLATLRPKADGCVEGGN
jgi:hypothetical protein